VKTPIAVKLGEAITPRAYSAAFDADAVEKLRRHAHLKGPAIVAVRGLRVLEDVEVAVLDPEQVAAIADGDWQNAILLVLDPLAANPAHGVEKDGDAEFLEAVSREAPRITKLAKQTLESVRKLGVTGSMTKEGSRWVNRPLNSFTLKIQSRVENLHFTIYGNPDSYDAVGFLLKDQNSYSRGWVRTPDDIEKFASLAAEAHSRRER